MAVVPRGTFFFGGFFGFGRGFAVRLLPFPFFSFRFIFIYMVASALASCPLARFFSGFSSFAFSGARALPLGRRSSSVSGGLAFALSLVPAGSSVSVGCAGGVDAAVRSFCAASPSLFRLSVFSVSEFSRSASGAVLPVPASFAARSAACLGSVVSVGGLLVAFPVVECPLPCVPSRSFSGGGSGSWGSAALAAGLGASVVVALPSSACFSLPRWSGGRWAFVGSGGASVFSGVPTGASLSSGCDFWMWVPSPSVSAPSLFS